MKNTQECLFLEPRRRRWCAVKFCTKDWNGATVAAETEPDTEVLGALLAAVPSHICFCFFVPLQLVFTPFLMSEWCEVTRRQRRHDKTVPGMACAVRTASSRVAVRGVQDAVVPQQGHVPMLRQTHDEYIHEWSQTAAWPQQGEGSHGALAHLGKQHERGSPRSCTGSVGLLRFTWDPKHPVWPSRAPCAAQTRSKTSEVSGQEMNTTWRLRTHSHSLSVL